MSKYSTFKYTRSKRISEYLYRKAIDVRSSLCVEHEIRSKPNTAAHKHEKLLGY